MRASSTSAISRAASLAPTCAIPAELALYGYDATANGNEGIGRLTAAQNDGADIALQYDARGQVIADTRTIAGHSYTTQYSYDAAGRLSAMTYPSGRTVNYVHSSAGEVTGITTQAPGGNAETVLANIAWEAFGPASGFTFGNGIAETRSYDVDGYLTQLTATGSAGTLYTRSYSRDLAGRITGITDSDPLRNETYDYDNVDRLTDATGPYGTRSYDYDAVGNRTSQDEDSNTSAYAYGSTSNRLYQVTGTDATSLDYDANGNTVSKGDKTFAYNAANRLASITLPGETISFAYSALGERVRKTSSQGTTHFHYDRAGHLIAESDAAGVTIREYIWLGDTPVALVATRNAGTTPELFAVHTDHLATTLQITDSTQATVWQYSREPFGELVAGNNAVRWPLRFPGQYEDDETGIFYNYFRDYDSTIGRYIESDPIGLNGGINTYAYAGGRPLAYVDSTGEMWGAVLTVAAIIGADYLYDKYLADDVDGYISENLSCETRKSVSAGMATVGAIRTARNPVKVVKEVSNVGARIVEHNSKRAARRAAEREAGMGRHGGRENLPDQTSRPGSQSPQGAPGTRTEVRSTDTGRVVHHDPYGHRSGDIPPHYGVDGPGMQGTTHHTYPSSHNPSANR